MPESFISWLNRNKSAVSLAIAILAMLTPVYYNILSSSNQSFYNAKRIQYYDEYVKQSEKSRVEAITTIGKMLVELEHQKEDINEIKTGINSLIEYNKNQQEMIQKFYMLNPTLTNPRFSKTSYVLKQDTYAN